MGEFADRLVAKIASIDVQISRVQKGADEQVAALTAAKTQLQGVAKLLSAENEAALALLVKMGVISVI